MHFIAFRSTLKGHFVFDLKFSSLMSLLLGTIQVSRQQRSEWVGSENGIFFWFTVNTTPADVGGWMGLKNQKHADVILVWSFTHKLKE